jgi:ParB-like chromosome segregation protein Spo0J
VVDTPGVALSIPVDRLRANSWNPNKMDEAMYAKELKSIERFGFVDPVTVREVGMHDYEIIDGEHRVKAARELGMTEVPCHNLGLLDDDTARELTIVLNETRGTSDRERLSELLKDLASRRDERQLREIMPFGRERFDELLDRKTIDWSGLEEKRQALAEQSERRWVERVYRMPVAAAEVVDDAVARVMESEEVAEDWRALELIAAEYLSSG